MSDQEEYVRLQEEIRQQCAVLKLETREAELRKLEDLMASPGFWDDPKNAAMIGQRAEMMRSDLATWRQLQSDANDLRELAEVTEETETSAWQQLTEQYRDLEKRFRETQLLAQLSGPFDDHAAILSLHAGAGGVDAQDWTEMLLRMYLRYAERKGWKTQVLEEMKGGEAGIKRVTVHLQGPRAYGLLKGESGVHRLVRISPFDAAAARHTSFSLCEVIPEIEDEHEVAIDEKELQIDTYRSSGHGGQSVNTTDSAVRITHKPTGIVVTCQNERSQRQNKEFAMKMLRAKLAQRAETERVQRDRELRGEHKSAEWGNQIRSYVLHPYKLVKDHRTNLETKDPDAVLDGALDEFISSALNAAIQ